MKRFGFSSEEKIKSNKELSLLFEKGKVLYSQNRKIKAVYLVEDSNYSGVKAAFAVYKKSGNAVWRNRVKRLLRESFRLNKEKLISYCKTNGKRLLIVFSLNTINKKNSPKICLEDVFHEVISLLTALEKKI